MVLANCEDEIKLGLLSEVTGIVRFLTARRIFKFVFFSLTIL